MLYKLQYLHSYCFGLEFEICFYIFMKGEYEIELSFPLVHMALEITIIEWYETT